MPARTLTHNGMTQTISAWAKHTGQSPQLLYWRLSQGWTIERTLTTPARKHTSRPTRSAIFETEFHKLVCTIDGALRIYRKRVGSLALEELDRGATKMFPRSRCDRSTPAA
ncbi:hypothetical protein XH83_15410 [Bradyrhizobium sp. CCBAU 53351]|uniref:hypothetical protein n=1 Tax=Bradyrhizobium sp. CCBAU 53351 TaxID=1325114 RepID=UPI001889322A|nr:hypothetical protein [Bradyrhizobium sp. CCBAU 53351]QOZ76717.1 hypothetical protein XH83_15410 [Bradyrhizobium sp. CCBAU 53351]